VKPDETASVQQFNSEANLLDLLRPLLVAKNFDADAAEFLSRLAHAMGFERASLGMVANQRIKLVATSDGDQKIRAPAMPEVVAAMEECILQDTPLSYPHLSSDFPYIVIAHSKLVHTHRLAAALTVPLGQDGQLIGAITLEKYQQNALQADQLALVEQVAHHAGPLIKLKWSMAQPLPLRLLQAVPAQIGQKGTARRRLWTISALALAVCAIFLFAVPMSASVSGQARLEAMVQRMVSSPIDGYLKAVAVRPGDRVQANQVLAELNDDTLRTERRKLEAEAQQQENSLVEAMVKSDRTQIVLRRAKLDEVLAQKDLVSQELARTQLVAPFDGAVIKGDLTQLLGSPIKRGDILLTLSQGTGFRVIVEVPERDIGDMQVGQRGTLVLSALPATRFPIRVKRIMPVADVSSDGRNVFELEAELEGDADKLVPGLHGVAKITVADKPIGWKWTLRVWHALSFLAWSRL
jgi:multidrug resistance efflux pump